MSKIDEKYHWWIWNGSINIWSVTIGLIEKGVMDIEKFKQYFTTNNLLFSPELGDIKTMLFYCEIPCFMIAYTKNCSNALLLDKVTFCGETFCYLIRSQDLLTFEC